MKIADIIALIEKNRPCIKVAMREANYKAFMNTSFKYEVRLLPDGSTETRERLASDDWWRSEDSSVCQIACYCYQYYDALGADMNVRQMVRELCKDYNMESDERTAYQNWMHDYKSNYDEYPDEFSRLIWIQNHTEAYERAYHRFIAELVAETDYNEQINDLIGDLQDLEGMSDE